MQDDHESSMQLLDFSSNNQENNNEKYWKELMNDNHEYYDCIFDNDLDVNEPSDADTQSDKELENFRPVLYDWALRNNAPLKCNK